MAHVAVADLDKAEKDQLVCTYAALLLADAGLDIDADKLKKVIKSTGNNVAAYWPAMFANAMANHSVADLVANVGCGGGGAPAAAAGPADTAAPAKEAKKEEPEEEEVDMDMGGLFGDDY